MYQWYHNIIFLASSVRTRTKIDRLPIRTRCMHCTQLLLPPAHHLRRVRSPERAAPKGLIRPAMGSTAGMRWRAAAPHSTSLSASEPPQEKASTFVWKPRFRHFISAHACLVTGHWSDHSSKLCCCCTILCIRGCGG